MMLGSTRPSHLLRVTRGYAANATTTIARITIVSVANVATVTNAASAAGHAPPPINAPQAPATKDSTEIAAPTPPATKAPTTPPSVTTPPVVEPASKAAAPAADAHERARDEAEITLRQSVLPQAITRERFAQLLLAIDPTLPTNTTVAEAFTAYTTAFRGLSEVAARTMQQLLAAAYTFERSREAFVPRATPELVALLQLRTKTLAAARAAEGVLMNAVEAATPGESRARLARERLAFELARRPSTALLVSTGVSLISLVNQAKFNADNLLVLDAELLSYAAAMTAATRAHGLRVRDGELARAEIEVDAGMMWRAGTPALVTTTERALASVDALEFEHELMIRDLQFDTLRRLRQRLPHQEGRRLIELWQHAVHPELFDDERVLARVAADLLAVPSTDAEKSQIALDILETAYVRLEPLGRTACEAADGILPRAANASSDGATVTLAEIRARSGLLFVQKQRRTVIAEALLRLRGLIGTDAPALITRLEDSTASLAALDRADQFERTSLDARASEIEGRVAVGEEIPALPRRDNESVAPPPPSSDTSSKPAANTEKQSNRSARGSRRLPNA